MTSEIIEKLIKKGEGQATVKQANHFFIHAIALELLEIIRLLEESRQ